MEVANAFQLKSIGIAAKKTDKTDAFKLAEKLKVQIVSGVQQIVTVTVPPIINGLRKDVQAGVKILTPG